ncbi:RDD family protein [Dermabacter sp. Marseille-Q3180]|uniref:RDD family protein n=1 Tax=Dermabacter sp. Marseille-Q3180 TaxID=2758090 RepID=UPI0020249A66|nr:RDD family protein [Dermabacter sp. Marseille-Q3180]
MNRPINSDESVENDAQAGAHPGEVFGLPDRGRYSIAPLPRRFLSMCLDWAAAAAVSFLAFHYDPLATLALFLAQVTVMQTLFGASLGQFLTGLRVLPVTGRSPMLLRALVRSAIMLSVISAFVVNENRQTLHDLVAGVVVVRSQ